MQLPTSILLLLLGLFNLSFHAAAIVSDARDVALSILYGVNGMVNLQKIVNLFTGAGDKMNNQDMKSGEKMLDQYKKLLNELKDPSKEIKEIMEKRTSSTPVDGLLEHFQNNWWLWLVLFLMSLVIVACIIFNFGRIKRKSKRGVAILIARWKNRKNKKKKNKDKKKDKKRKKRNTE